MKYAIIAIGLVLSGCTATGQAVLRGDVTDAVIERLENVNDTALNGLEQAQAALDAKQARLNALKCRFPFTALVRYAQQSEERRMAVLRDCGLDVEVQATVVSVPE